MVVTIVDVEARSGRIRTKCRGRASPFMPDGLTLRGSLVRQGARAGTALLLATCASCADPTLAPVPSTPPCVDSCTGQTCQTRSRADAEIVRRAVLSLDKRTDVCINYRAAAESVRENGEWIYVELPFEDIGAQACSALPGEHTHLYAAMTATSRAAVDIMEIVYCGRFRGKPYANAKLYDASIVFTGTLAGTEICRIVRPFGNNTITGCRN